MNIAVNTRLLLPDKLEGIGRFSNELLRRITQNHPEHQFYFLFDRPYSAEFVFGDNVHPIVAPPKARHPVLFYYWFEKVIPRFLGKYKIDLFLSPDGYLSLSSKVKSIAVIHDLNFYHRPNDLPFIIRKYYNSFFPKFAKRADRIVTVSEYSKNDICISYGIEPAMVDVVFNGVSEEFAPIPEELKINVRNTYSEGCPFFLFVGSLHKRKNISNLVLAFDSFKERTNSNFKLVLVGEHMFKDKKTGLIVNNASNTKDIIFTGRVPSAELCKITAAAHAMVFVPFFEGFGLPVLESMACGVPVIASNVTSLPEIAGNCALFANPDDVDSISRQMEHLVNDANLYNKLAVEGIERAKKFNWDNSSEKLWKSMEKLF